MATISWISLAVVLIVSLINIPPTTNAKKRPGNKVPRNVIRNCWDQQKKKNISGIYDIYPYKFFPDYPVKVYCDMETDGGGWTVIQRRDDIEPRRDFYLTFMEYALGFGDLEGEFWLGLDHINALTDQTRNNIRFDLDDFEGNSTWAKYNFFYVHERSLSYKLEVNGYSGDAGDSFTYHNGMQFSTKDKGTTSCAVQREGAWWYNSCAWSNLNGVYLAGEHDLGAYMGVIWFHWRGADYSLKKTEMKIRPVH